MLWTDARTMTPDEFTAWLAAENANHMGTYLIGLHPDAPETADQPGTLFLQARGNAIIIMLSMEAAADATEELMADGLLPAPRTGPPRRPTGPPSGHAGVPPRPGLRLPRRGRDGDPGRIQWASSLTSPDTPTTITITPAERALLDTIASTEAPDYDVMYGHGWSGEDRRFTSYADHPRKFWPILNGPNEGRRSSAAGRYQFLGSTWDHIAGRYGLTDFTPPSQDMGAVALAREDYSRKTGRDLTTDLASGDPTLLAQVGQSLSQTHFKFTYWPAS